MPIKSIQIGAISRSTTQTQGVFSQNTLRTELRTTLVMVPRTLRQEAVFLPWLLQAMDWLVNVSAESDGDTKIGIAGSVGKDRNLKN